MYYNLLIIWLFITFMLFLCVFIYAKILLSVDDLIRKSKVRQKQLLIEESIDELKTKFKELDLAILKFNKRRAREK